MFIGLSEYDLVVVDPGSGVSGPPGLEARLEYNGLVINDTQVYDKYRVMSIDGLADADIRDNRSTNPARHGETAYQAFYGGRTLVINGRIEAHSLFKLRDMQQNLRLAFNELEEKPLIFHAFQGAQYDMVIYCRKGASMTMPEKQDDWRYFRDFQITLRASNPRFLTYDQKAVTWIATSSSASFQFMFGPSNDGTFNAEPKIQITGPITDPQIFNHATDQTFMINGSIPSGETWTADVASRTVIDNYGVTHLGAIAPSSEWITIEPGNNYFEISASGMTSGESSVSLLYHNTWI